MLKGRFPEILKLLWKDQTDYSQQRAEAEEAVTTDLDSRGFDIRKLQIPLSLHTAGAVTVTENGTSAEDEISRQRFYYNVTEITGAATLTLEGRHEETDSWETVMTVSLTVTGEGSVFFSNVYRHYRLNTTVGTSINYSAYLVENIYTQLFKIKTLELIINDNNKDGQMTDQLVHCIQEYKDTINRAKLRYDSNNDRILTDSETLYDNEIRLSV